MSGIRAVSTAIKTIFFRNSFIFEISASKLGPAPHIKAIFCDKFPNPVLWFEVNLELVELAVQYNRLGGLIDSKRVVHLSTIPDDQAFQDLLEEYIYDDIVICGHRASYSLQTDYHNFHKGIENFLKRKRINTFTLSRFDRLWMRNILNNFNILINARPVKELFKSATGKIALICGAGPSLEADISKIKELRKNIVLIAVDTALIPLISNEIDPDIVLCVDPQSMSRHYTEGYNGKAHFVVDPASCYISLRHIAKLGSERIFYFWSPFVLSHLLFTFLNLEPGKVAFGGSVSTNAYDLAYQMGCNPILLSGHDLTFSNNLAHVRGAALEDLLRLKQNRLFRNELHNYRQLYALPLRYLKGDFDEDHKQLPTNDKLLIFYQWFNRRFQQDLAKGIKIFKLSAKGASFEGILNVNKEVKLKSVFTEKSSRELFFLSSKKYRERFLTQSLKSSEKKDYLKKQRQKFVLSIYEVCQEFSDYILIVQRGLELAQKLYASAREPMKEDYIKTLVEMEKIDEKIKGAKKVSIMASEILQGLIHQVNKSLSSKAVTMEEKKYPELRLAKQSLELYSGFFEATITYQKWLKRAAKAIEATDAFKS